MWTIRHLIVPIAVVGVIAAIVMPIWPVLLILFGLACGFLVLQRIDHGRTHRDNPQPAQCSWCRDDLQRMRSIERERLAVAEMRRFNDRYRPR